MMKETLKILSFQTAIGMQNEREKYDHTKWIYVPDFYTDYRYILGTVGNNHLLLLESIHRLQNRKRWITQ